MYPRNLASMLLEAAQDSPVILLNGARQTGKSTLAQTLYPPARRPPYLSLDDLTVLAAATQSPQDFVDGLPERVILDEVQRAPGLFLALKRAVDRDRTPGRFFLTGSANVLALPKLSESLAGRMEIHTLWPLSQGELRGREEAFVDGVFSADRIERVEPVGPDALIRAIVAGGYPESLNRDSPRRRDAWFRGYLTTLLQRDVKDLSNIEGLKDLPNLLALLASRAGALLNLSDLARSLGLPNTTLRRYLTLLEAVFLVVPLAAWAGNIGKRLVKAPKLYLNDTGLLCHLLGLNDEALLSDRNKLGPVLENFVVMELIKQAGWSAKQPRIHHFRTQTGQEVDVVLETADGKLVGVEVKAAGTVTEGAFKGLWRLREETGERFRRGIVLYCGEQTVSFGEDLIAAPVSALWAWRSRAVGEAAADAASRGLLP